MLERLEGAGATRALERLLLRPERSAAERAAAALGRVGGADSVQDLRALIERVSRASTREAAQHAIAAIQHRLPGAEPGQISMTVAEAQTGALSVAGEGGELSHAPELRGQLMKSTHQ